MLWVLFSLLLAAVIAPWLYRAGTSLGKAAEAQDLPVVLEWIGRSSAGAKFSRFYNRSLALAALLLLPLLFRRIRMVRASSLWTCEKGALISWKCGLGQAAVGCLISGGLLWCLGMMLYHWGAYVVSPKQMSVGRVIGAVVVPALAAGMIEEWLFRGLLLGLWVRFSKSSVACVGTSLFFASIHFLEPPVGWKIANPAAPLAGFELLGKIMFHFLDPQFFVTDFATLFTIGMILAWARLRTGALWFPIGLHVGWILAFKGYNLFHRSVPDNALHPWGIGDSLRSGLFPMLTLAVTALCCRWALARFYPEPPVSPASQ